MKNKEESVELLVSHFWMYYVVTCNLQVVSHFNGLDVWSCRSTAYCFKWGLANWQSWVCSPQKCIVISFYNKLSDCDGTLYIIMLYHLHCKFQIHHISSLGRKFEITPMKWNYFPLYLGHWSYFRPVAPPQSSFCTQMNSSSQKTSVIPLVNMWTSRLLWNSPALHVWLYADSLFALKHHQSVDSVTGICFCILKPSACGETIEKRHLQTEPLMLIDSYHCFCLQLFSFPSLLRLYL